MSWAKAKEEDQLQLRDWGFPLPSPDMTMADYLPKHDSKNYLKIIFTITFEPYLLTFFVFQYRVLLLLSV